MVPLTEKSTESDGEIGACQGFLAANLLTNESLHLVTFRVAIISPCFEFQNCLYIIHRSLPPLSLSLSFPLFFLHVRAVIKYFWESYFGLEMLRTTIERSSCFSVGDNDAGEDTETLLHLL